MSSHAAGGGRGRNRRRSARPDSGAVAVELAMVLPILIMLMLGITTAGLSYSQAIGVTNAVREGGRFGATTDAAVPLTWSNDVISRVRATQFDDPGAQTGVCVQLWRKGSGAGYGQLAGKCDSGSVSGLSLPTTATEAPAVPASVPTGACVVRVIAGRNFTINIGLASWTQVRRSDSVSRYEREDAVPACKLP